jgi:hypothetical protein
MKKFFIFAIALVASVLAFTSCEGNKIDSPIVGTWAQIQEDMEDFITFDGKGNYTFIENYYFYDQETGKKIEIPHEHIVIKGSFKIDGDIITVHNDTETISMDGGPAQEIEWEPYDEQMKFSISGNTLHLIRDYGTEYAFEQEFYKQ